MKRKRMSDADRARHARVQKNLDRLRELAEKAQADLDRRRQQRESA